MFTIRRVILGVVAVTLMLTTGVVAADESSSSASHQRRELWDFFDFLMIVGIKPMDPACHECYEHHLPLTKKEDLVKRSSYKPLCVNKCCPHFCGDDATADDTSVASYSTVDNGDVTNNARDTGSAGAISNAANGLGIWMFFLAGSVLAAMAAIHMGQKKKPKVVTNKHPMAGSVNRRVGAVSAFADGALGSSLAGGAAASGAADTGVELQSGYHIDAQPDGSFEIENGTRVV